MTNQNTNSQNNQNNQNNIPLSEDILFNYISGITQGKVVTDPNKQNSQKKGASSDKLQTTTQQNNISTKTDANQNNATDSRQSSQQSSAADVPPPSANDMAELEKIRKELQKEMQQTPNKTNEPPKDTGNVPSNFSTDNPNINQAPSPQQRPSESKDISSTQVSSSANQTPMPPTVKLTNKGAAPTPQPPQHPKETAAVSPSPKTSPITPTNPINPSEIQESPTISIQNIEMPLLLEEVIKRNASDLHLAVGYPPLIRIDGKLIPVGSRPLSPKDAERLIYSIISPEKRDILEVNKEVDFAYSYKDLGRFRVNAYHSKGYLTAALRLIPNRIRSIEELNLPKQYHQLADLEQGFVLVTGPTGHGKSTTLAAIIQEINLKYPKHILTIEDPIEYVFPPAKALVTQRELSQDTNSWKIALRSALREDPDVVLIGEMRDYETIAAALHIAETGHLVFSTLHTNSASQTIDRIISVFPAEQQNKVRAQLAEVIRVVISQRLIPLKQGGRIPVSEVMIMNNAIKNLIREGKIYQIDNVIRTGAQEGMISLERSLVQLVQKGLITKEEAKKYAWAPDEIDKLMDLVV